jgi:hypothetical protein
MGLYADLCFCMLLLWSSMLLYAPLRLYDLRHSCTVSTLCLSTLFYAFTLLLYAEIMLLLCLRYGALRLSLPMMVTLV